MVHLLSIAFFFGLLVVLAAILEFTLRTHGAAIVAALRGPGEARAAMAATAEGPARGRPGVHAVA